MNTGSLARRTVVATLGVLVFALGGFATLITLRYRDGLRARARSQLIAGARAITDVPQEQMKPLFASLALEGIDVQLGSGPPTSAKLKGAQDGPLKPGTLSSAAHLLTLTEQISVGGKPATATLSTSEASVDSAVNRLIVIELVGGAAVLLAATVLTLLASRSALRPLRHVAAVAQGIAAGDRRQRLHPRRPQTELGQMAASFDAMVDSLEEAVAQATRSEAAMRRFLADASHELRTPIAALQATIETLLREQPPRPRRDQLEAEVARGTQRLGRLVDDLLNLARLEANEPLR
ncbi:MAG TPA: HAMP domain-containing sensor histidine kinase, partial [Solirubrobacteraceae bacterium]|nr:HAMP domain-containing sensor histidine kinase [Solirubrobacteraceae bacterium]